MHPTLAANGRGKLWGATHRPLTTACLIAVVGAHWLVHQRATVLGRQHKVHIRQMVALLQAQQLQLYRAGAGLEVGVLPHDVQPPIHDLGGAHVSVLRVLDPLKKGGSEKLKSSQSLYYELLIAGHWRNRLAHCTFTNIF